MTDLPPHRRFERQIERIHQLLEVEGSVVTWDDHIPDPDNPSQLRQIDISIRRDGALTIVECRLHKTPQDVTWIEELIGRRVSLNADAVIAVSASGFTTTAREKANRYGIHLRDVRTLSPDEIVNWGRRWTLTLSFCEFTQVCLTVRLSAPPKAGPNRLTDADGKPLGPLFKQLLFQSLMHLLDLRKWTGNPININAPIDGKLLVNGKPPIAIGISAKVRRIKKKVELASVFEYVDPLPSLSHADVGSYELGQSEIIENGDHIAMTIDLSTVAVPENCCFETVQVDAGRIVKARPQFIGTEQVMICRIPIKILCEGP